jgi:hypothetical protein
MVAWLTTQPRPKALHWFVAQAIALSLIGFWPAPRDAYPALFQAHANALSGALAPNAARFAPSQIPGTDTEMTVAAPRAGPAAAWQSSFSVDRIGYWPSAALLAMLLATPLAPLRRALAAAAGLVLVDLFVLARVGVEIAYLARRFPNAPSDAAQGLVDRLLLVGSESLTATIPSAAFVLVCWVALARPWRTIDLSAARRVIGDSPRTGER